MGLLDYIPVVGPAIQAVGGMYAANQAYKGQMETNAANAQQADLNRQFQERMSNTAAQRAVADYTKAGLNPALAYDHTASSPSGAQATMQNPRGESANIMASSASSAGAALMQIAQIRNVQAQTHQLQIESLARAEGQRAVTEGERVDVENKKLEGDRTRQQRDVFNAQWPDIIAKLKADILNVRSGAENTAADTALKRALLPGAQNQAAVDRMWYGRNVRPFLNDAGSLLRNGNSAKKLFEF